MDQNILKKFMLNYYKKLYTWLLPYHCILCGGPSTRQQDLCQECYLQLPLIKFSCQGCAIPLPRNGTRCGQCLQKPPPFERAFARYHYCMPIIRLVLELKFKQKLVNAKLLGELLVESILHDWYVARPLPDLIVPVPLHRSRLQARGFNQALEIARPVSAAIQRPINKDVCQRTAATLPQATLSAALRQQNVHKAFSVNGDFAGRHIAVIDDVITTGATMGAFCKVLKQHGAKTIDVWCAARAGPF